MSADKKAAPAAPRFQERLKTQITRSTVILLTAFLILFGGLLAIYSEGYTHYENRAYNQQLTESFGGIYRSCAGYLRDTDNTAVMRSFLDGQISEQSMSYQFHRFSYASLREEVDMESCPRPFRGVPIHLITMGLMAMAMIGFYGLHVN